MAQLNTTPRSSSKQQHQKLVIVGTNKGFELAEVRRMVGGSITALSALECSNWIKHFGGGDLANPPGQKPRPYRRKRTDSVRVIHTDHVEQINRLGLEYFHDEGKFHNWLEKNFKVRDPDALAIATRAGEVIRALKLMHRRSKGVVH